VTVHFDLTNLLLI